jgi:hypothetical protein
MHPSEPVYSFQFYQNSLFLMKTKHVFQTLIAFLFSIGMFSCQKSSSSEDLQPQPQEALSLIKEATAPDMGMKIKILSPQALFMGYNQVYVSLTDANEQPLAQNYELSI